MKNLRFVSISVGIGCLLVACSQAPSAAPFRSNKASQDTAQSSNSTVATSTDASQPGDSKQQSSTAETNAATSNQTSTVGTATGNNANTSTDASNNGMGTSNNSGAMNNSSTNAGTSASSDANLVFAKANLTNYESYPDPNSEECLKYSGCDYEGMFAALDGKQSEDWVKANNIIAVHSKDFGRYKLKTLRIRSGSKTIDAKVYDECADSDCDGCCTENARSTGFLIDIEKYTKARFGVEDGVIEWACIDCK